MELLKFITCGSVDDGKSTLIGHILYDSKLLYADQEKALELDSKVGSRGGEIDYSLLLDGLMAEREQGITIDVAYRYFTTEKRSFIVADTPGHEEYTRNMAVGASFADLAIILIDAKQGVLIQTKRHARICALMGIKNFVFAINKMDLVLYSKERFDEITAQIEELSKELKLQNKVIIPVSATEGDNITSVSENTKWYNGPSLIDYLETVDVGNNDDEKGFYMPVQRVCRPNHTFRGFQGQVEAGSVSVGDEVTILPSNETANIKSLHILDKEATEISKGQAVTIQLDKEVDVSRGCVIAKDAELISTSSIEVTMLWMDDEVLEENKNFYVKLGTKLIPGVVSKVNYSIDVNTGEQKQSEVISKNELAVCELQLADSITVDTFAKHKTLGELILIDRVTNMTSACGVVTQLFKASNDSAYTKIDREVRSGWKNQRAITVEIPLKDKVDIDYVRRLERELSNRGRHTYVYVPKSSHGIKSVVKHLNDAGILVLLAASSDIDVSVFTDTRGYYSGWFDFDNLSVSDVADAIYKISGLHGSFNELDYSI